MVPSVVMAMMRVVRRGSGGQHHNRSGTEHHGACGKHAGKSVNNHRVPFS